MPSGKTHAVIGVDASVIAGYALTMTNFTGIESIQAAGIQISNTAKFMMPMVTGALLGSLIVDIDSKRSQASQAFAKVLTAVVISVIGLKLFMKYGIDYKGTTTLAGKYLNMMLSYMTSSKGMLLFATITILGKLSPHRGFTHKWFGTFCFLMAGYLSMNRIMFVGFSIGYVLHLLADNFLTKEKIHFHRFRLPCQNANGKMNIVW